MSAIEFLLAPGMAPFTGAFALVAGLLLVELVMVMLGGSLIGDGEGPELDADADVGGDIDADFEADVDADVDLDADADLDAGADHAAPTGIAGWLGFGEVPFIIWLAGILTAFGLSGYVLQLVSGNVYNVLLHPVLAAAIALLPGLRIGRTVARTLGRLVPKTETSAISRRSLGDRRGVVVQGTARRGHPAQARVRDGHGNLHYVRVEPIDDGVEIPTGTVVLIRGGRGPVLGAIPIDT